MMKKFIALVAILSFVAACAKKTDGQPAVEAPAPASPIPAGSPGSPAPTTAPGSVDSVGTPEQSPSSAASGGPDIILNEQYSGAADDLINQYLTNEMSRVKDGVQQSINLNRAHQVLKAGLVHNNDGTIHLSLTMMSKSSDKVLKLTGHLNNRGEAKLRGVGADQGIHVSGSLKCADENATNTCETTVVNLEFKESGRVSTVAILFRSSDAIFNVNFPDDDISDTDYVKVVRLFKNTEYQITEGNSLKLIRMNSYEVINGRSGMTLSLLSRENEFIQFKFPLIKQQDEDKTEIAVDRRVDPKEAFEITGQHALRSKISESLTDVTLVNNTGRGDVTLLVKMKALKNASSKTIKMTFKRHLKSVTF
jgi:hypothetical protein